MAAPASSNGVAFSGVMRLHASEYEKIVSLLDEIAQQKPAQIILDLRELEFLNSSGIGNLFKFVAKTRGSTRLIVRGSSEIAWQKKSLPNFQTIAQGLELEMQ